MENLGLFQHPWYYGKINRQEAEENLIDRGENEGCFLVRESQTRPGQWTISVLDWIDGACGVGHYLISQNQEGNFFFEDDVIFDSIAELVSFYKEHTEGVCFVLKEPCPRQLQSPDKDANKYDLYEIATELPEEQEFVPEKVLYTGSISATWKGYLKPYDSVPVVAKIAKDPRDARHSLNHEANMLKYLNHENIVRFKGAISSRPEFHVVLQWAGDINLIGFLLNNSSLKLSVMDQLNIAIQIASGLEYCGKLKCVHRNIKAKSVIINTKDLKCRVASFKSSRTVDQYGFYHAASEEERHDALHSSCIRWMPLEAARHGRFSQASDVWSFSILLVEIFTSGGLPYAGYLTCKVLQQIEDGFRCPKPQSCPKEIYDLMHRCWAALENERPSFREIKDALKTYVEDNRETLTKLQPPKPSEWSRYAPWKHGSVKQQRTSTIRIVQRNPASPLPPVPATQYSYDN